MSDLSVHEEFKTALHEGVREALPSLLTKYYEMLMTTQDPEILRKGINMMIETIDAKAERKQDAFAHLPVFHFNIGRGIKVTAIEDDPLRTIDLEPTAAMSANRQVNQDVMFDD